MESKIKFSKDDEKKLRDLPVSALVLFGSRVQGLARENSDYDIGVLVSNRAALEDEKKRKNLYNSLYDILSANIAKLTNIDIVFLEKTPAELKAHVIKNGQLIYGDPLAFATFKEREMIAYADFASLREIFQKATLARMA
ncbi:MAG: DNA polymerase beta domain-containing protein [Parcubacteria group bacterium Gr01-1014_73]|nr:MAG: DNA polymerase beta domain-containing protein [Parcubacteria group bacterium Gr01-1014_73]